MEYQAVLACLIRRKLFVVVFGITLTLLSVMMVRANGQITFTNIAADDGAGIDYRRTPSSTNVIFENFKQQSLNPATPYTFENVLMTPEKPRGAPGVAILDYDGDGDLDIYATNGPNRANSLYANQLEETGQLTFVDVAVGSGSGATAQDSTGVCYGDVDNDGDPDLLVLGRMEDNIFLENQGDGTFVDETASRGLGGGALGHTSCSMGDVNGDGLLDVAVANSFDWINTLPIFTEPFDLNHHNQLFVNRGDGVFEDVSQRAGLEDLAGLPPGFEGSPTLTWAIAMVDYDLDGDMDILHADDQAAYPRAIYGGLDRGFVHVLQNDGTGHFTDVTVHVGTNHTGQWMGLSFGDFNSDGNLDFFGTNMGDYIFAATPPPYQLGESTSRWFMGQSDGTFDDPGVGDLIGTPFGWGTSTLDYDNDGDTDIAYFGHIITVIPYVPADNPGTLLINDGEANFRHDEIVFANSGMSRRGVDGSAVGDLNSDGFVDVVTVAHMDYPEPIPLGTYAPYGGPFDDTAYYVQEFIETGPFEFMWNGVSFPDGTLSVEINSGDNGNRWVAISPRGTVDILDNAETNRDGIGAVVMFTPQVRSNRGYFIDGPTVMQPIMGGSSYASQDSLTANFGLGDAKWGNVEVLWPGGVRNRLYGVRRSKHIVFPEIPCSYDDAWEDVEAYGVCVADALVALYEADEITWRQLFKFYVSALIAYYDH